MFNDSIQSMLISSTESSQVSEFSLENSNCLDNHQTERNSHDLRYQINLYQRTTPIVFENKSSLKNSPNIKSSLTTERKSSKISEFELEDHEKSASEVNEGIQPHKKATENLSTKKNSLCSTKKLSKVKNKYYSSNKTLITQKENVEIVEIRLWDQKPEKRDRSKKRRSIDLSIHEKGFNKDGKKFKVIAKLGNY